MPSKLVPLSRSDLIMYILHVCVKCIYNNLYISHVQTRAIIKFLVTCSLILHNHSKFATLRVNPLNNREFHP